MVTKTAWISFWNAYYNLKYLRRFISIRFIFQIYQELVSPYIVKLPYHTQAKTTKSSERNELTGSGRSRQDQRWGHWCPVDAPWPSRRGASSPAASPCGRRRNHASRCGDRRRSLSICDAPGDHETTRWCHSARPKLSRISSTHDWFSLNDIHWLIAIQQLGVFRLIKTSKFSDFFYISKANSSK